MNSATAIIAASLMLAAAVEASSNCETDAPTGGGQWGTAPQDGTYTLGSGLQVYCEHAGGRVWTKISAWDRVLLLTETAINANGCAASGITSCKHADNDINGMATGDRVYRIKMQGRTDKAYLYTTFPYVDVANSFGMEPHDAFSRGATASQYPGNNLGSWGQFGATYVDFLNINGGQNQGESCERYFIGHNSDNNDDCYSGASGAVRCINGGRDCESGEYALLEGVSVWIIDPNGLTPWILGESGVDECPSGFTHITADADECGVASEALGLTYDASKNHNADPNAACIWCGGCNPQTTRLSPTHGTSAKWVCKRTVSTPPPTTLAPTTSAPTTSAPTTSAPTTSPTSSGTDVTNAGNRRPGATGPAEDYPCKTKITVKYSLPAESRVLGPIVLGRGANGAQISLYPGTFRVASDVYVCDGVTGAELVGVAYRGESTVAYSGVGAMSIMVYAIDVRTVLDLDPYLQNIAPLITSIEINPQTVNVGEAATIKVTGYDFNDPDILARLDLSVDDRTTTRAITRTRGDTGTESTTLGFRTYSSGRTHSVGTETDASVTHGSEDGPFTFTPVASDFTDSSEASHSLVAKVTGRDTLGATGYGEIPFVVNRLDGVAIGAVTFSRPRVSLNVAGQNHVSIAQEGPARAVFDIFDPDSGTPPTTTYVESHTYSIVSIAPPVDATTGLAIDIAPGSTCNTLECPGNQVPRPGNTCNDGGCSYIDCECTSFTDDDGNVGCQEITATKVVLATGTQWTFEWNPWVDIEGDEIEDTSQHGTTFCELKVHFTDNTASASRTGSGSGDGLVPCVGNEATFRYVVMDDHEYGCSDYTSNHICFTDVDLRDGLRADQVCSSCGLCERSHGRVVSQVITEGLSTATASVLLQAKPQPSADLNYPPAISLFYAAHVDLAPDNEVDTTVTVTFGDAESTDWTDPPPSQLGYLRPECASNGYPVNEVADDGEDCFARISVTPVQTEVTSDPFSWREVYTFNFDAALPAGATSTLKVYLRLEDAADSSMVGFHEMATLTRLAASRRRRRQAAGDAAAPRSAGMTISIDENGRLTGQMEFPAGAVVSLDVDTAGDTAGGSTRAPDGGDTDRGDDRIQTDDGSSDRQLVIILALAGGVGCCCLLGAAICLGYAMLRRSGSAGIGPSPTRRPTKILVSGAAPGLDGPRKDPFAGFQTA